MRDSRFVDFVRHYNGDRDYFECHELMEELWLEEGRHPLLQGLLQAAVGLYHWSNGNRSGAVKLMQQSRRKLEGYPERVAGLDLDDLRECLDRSLKALLEQPESAPFEPFELIIVDPDLAELTDRQV
ncbi:DUF309 domain-containing protein [Cohnella sp. CFH 77786]|uniref:DUF309 domain-containing protein n=1 Tax=Cohnella sp. CFH 77786 TaxID=2662265 RepID=UPI001C608393|nr:DUF309 domain-containing protein [Cohnella sp. CFH 77786]MBW5445110.1 DUF309 domain-containing protein [Cohnella sp. CFH 77786]